MRAARACLKSGEDISENTFFSTESTEKLLRQNKKYRFLHLPQ